jgi:hypothetical protein
VFAEALDVFLDLQPPRAHATPVERIAATRRWGTTERPVATA